MTRKLCKADLLEGLVTGEIKVNVPASVLDARQGRKKHGAVGSITYSTWNSVKLRTFYCKDESKRIDVDPRWIDFEAFYDDMGDRPTLNHHLRRIDKKKGFYKENCQWYETSYRGKRKTLRNNKKASESPKTGWNKPITYRGVTKTVKQWAYIFEIPVHILYQRLTKLNWPFERALFEAVRQKDKKRGDLPMAMAAVLDRQRRAVDAIKEKEHRKKIREQQKRKPNQGI